jgi:hypothetical protein
MLYGFSRERKTAFLRNVRVSCSLPYYVDKGLRRNTIVGIQRSACDIGAIWGLCGTYQGAIYLRKYRVEYPEQLDIYSKIG